MKLVNIIPTYNEKDNVKVIIEKLLELYKKENLDGNVLIVDDNSPDGTGQIVDELAKEDTRINIIHREGKLGLGTAYIAGFKYAIKNLNADLLMTMDCDLSHDPKYIPGILEKIKEYDIVIGSRYVKGGGVYKWGLHRRIISKGANLLAKSILGLKANDCTSGFRCYKRKVIESINFDEIVSDSYSFLVEVLYRCQKKGFKIGESPIIFPDRKFGKTKISKKEIPKTIRTLIKLRLAEV